MIITWLDFLTPCCNCKLSVCITLLFYESCGGYVITCCMFVCFIDDGNGGWSNWNCTVLHQTGAGRRPVCQCGHLTNFAVLLVNIYSTYQCIIFFSSARPNCSHLLYIFTLSAYTNGHWIQFKMILQEIIFLGQFHHLREFWERKRKK